MARFSEQRGTFRDARARCRAPGDCLGDILAPRADAPICLVDPSPTPRDAPARRSDTGVRRPDESCCPADIRRLREGRGWCRLSTPRGRAATTPCRADAPSCRGDAAPGRVAAPARQAAAIPRRTDIGRSQCGSHAGPPGVDPCSEGARGRTFARGSCRADAA